ncbi:MAG: outer membrane protein assembly factor BamD [Myxococcota bacterium]
MVRVLLFGCLAVTVATGCKTTDTGTELTEPDYASDAETNLAQGNEALESKNFLDAERYFEYVRSKYPFLEASKHATLRLADLDFERERYLEARDRYRSFVKLYPTHPKVDYAAFRAALTHYKDMPSDFFLLPRPKQKDQAEVKSTLAAMQDFVRNFPKSPFVEEAQKLVDESRRRLAEHEMSVAEFYRDQKRWPGVVGRYKKVVAEYSGVGFDEEALFGLYEAYLQLNDSAQAKKTLETIVERLPGTGAATKAQRLLGKG